MAQDATLRNPAEMNTRRLKCALKEFALRLCWLVAAIVSLSGVFFGSCVLYQVSKWGFLIGMCALGLGFVFYTCWQDSE